MGIADSPGLLDALGDAASHDPSAPAIVPPGGAVLDYRALLAAIDASATTLADLGVPRGARVATVVPDGPRAALAFLAVASHWACAPLNPAYREAELSFYLDDLDAAAVLVAAELDSPVREVARRAGVRVVEVQPSTADALFVLDGPPRHAGDAPLRGGGSDVALVLHTSGTTARPKMVPLTHANLLASAHSVATALALERDDRCLCMMPLFHIHGIVAGLLASLVSGASVACPPGFVAPRFLAWLGELDPTWMTAVPTMYQGILSRLETEERAPGHRLRLLRSSSAALPPTVAASLERVFGAPVIEAYGMTEAAHQIASNPIPPATRKPGTVGRAAGPEVTILADDGRSLPRGSRGEVAIRGANVFAGYVAQDDANATSFTNGWFRTGDEGYLDDDGYLVLTGRLKEMINRGGEKIAPREIDEVLLQHPAVAQAVAFAVPHERLGEEVAAAVVRVPGASCAEAELQLHVASVLSDFKVPRRIVFIDEIPRGATGKLQRIGLAEKLGLDSTQAVGRDALASVPRSQASERLAALAAEVLELDRVTPEDDLFALGLDSVTANDLLARAVAEGIVPPASPTTIFLLHPTPAALAVAAAQGIGARSGDVVPLQQGGLEPPVFVVHGNDGRIVLFRALAARLGHEFPVHAFTLPSNTGELRDVAQLASVYAAELRTVHPAGPYAICGLCFGGAVGLEIARILAGEGRPPTTLALINPIGVEAPVVSTLGLGARNGWLRVGRAAGHLRRGTLRAALRRRIEQSRAAEPGDVAWPQRVLEPMRSAYRAQPYDGAGLLLCGASYRVRPDQWRRVLTRGMDWIEIGGSPGQEMTEPYVSRIAEVISEAIRIGR